MRNVKKTSKKDNKNVESTRDLQGKITQLETELEKLKKEFEEEDWKRWLL